MVSLKSPRSRYLPISNRPVRMQTRKGMGYGLNKPAVIELLTPAPVKGNDLSGLGEAEAPSAWDNTNKALSALSTTVGAGAKFYLERQQLKSAQSAASSAQSQADAARRAADAQAALDAEARRQALIAASQNQGGMPSWAIPAIIGVVAVGVGAFFLLRKKNG